MSESVHLDSTGIGQLAEVLRKAPLLAVADAAAVVAKGALNIKRDAQRRVTGLKHAPAYPYSIGFDLKTTLAQTSAEIGPDKQKRQGALGNLIEYGSVNNPPRPHILPATEAEIPKFEKALEALAKKALGER
jgi:hypothetical protein